MCDGPVVYGYPDLIDDFAFNIQRNQAVFGLFFNGETLLSHLPLVGERELASRIDYRVGRVATTAQYEFEQMTIDRLIQWGVELVKEYNIRIYYTRPLVVTDGKDFVTINTVFIQDIRSQFAKAGYSTGPVSLYPNFAPPWWMSLILMMGMVSAAMILLMRLKPLTVMQAWLLLAFGFLFALLSIMWEGAELLRAAWPLGGAVVFSALAVVGLMNNPWLTAGKTTNRLAMIITGVRLWLNACFVSLAGACIVAAYLTDIRHVLDMDFFRGVKLMYILPLAIVAVSYYWGSSFSREAMAVSGQRTLFPRRWQRSDIMILGFCGIVLAVYMLRSGHTSVSTWELTIRRYLDHLLWVRPRTKEFLVGHPFLILAVAAAVGGWRRYLGLFFILGAIGQISIINTFVHIRAPLMMGVIRTGNGLWLGAVVGVIGILAFDGLLRWHEKRVRG
jgi:hypothetical protein